ncbi:hypothetical protein MNEG_4193 [Monoraphidium neglectum]|uniref:Uncharacterized protein n=1 Tax=Monoraphidium neglectum TaxID=145388 RepID=A0A0D2JZ30_9CHLO|nr:hypothetical protein MNEG_4193 [Monoraphidium neglectum]KIZ03768.1 hypothetical protein MNEG_4193 [Monoraphidium neglectum]|eukprot:XP_013902787.1 hypothetical protein MNEG_4193 [Monoraphidium neglectum]
MFDCAAWSPTCQALANVSAAWMAEKRPPPPKADEEAFKAEAAADAAKPDEPPPPPGPPEVKCVPRNLSAPFVVLKGAAPAAATAPAGAAPVAGAAPTAARPPVPSVAPGGLPNGPLWNVVRGFFGSLGRR